MPKFLKTSNDRFEEMKKRLKVVIGVFTDVITSKVIVENDIAYLHKVLDDFYYEIFDTNFKRHWRVKLLTEILNAAVTVPIDNKIPKSQTLVIYRRLDIMNIVTFLIFQMRQIKYSGRRIKAFLEYIQDENEYCYYAMLFFRVNPQTVRNLICINLENVTPKELYFGISTGFFYYREEFSECYLRLVDMVSSYHDDLADDYDLPAEEFSDNPEIFQSVISAEKMTEFTPVSVLKQLRKDGFISKYAYDKLNHMHDEDEKEEP